MEQRPIKRFLLDYRVTPKDNLPDNFTLKNLETINDTTKINVLTKSNIFAPFSTTISNKEEQKQQSISPQLHKSLEKLNNIIQFCPLVVESNKQYEQINNGDAENEHLVPNQQGSFNLESSFYNDKNDQKQKSSSPLKFQSPWKEMNKTQSQLDVSKEPLNQHFNESLLKQVEDMGYSRDYIITCLKNNECNYCTASYYLLMKVYD